MKTEQLMRMINEFVDGELPKEKEAFLFTELSNDEVAREYFKKVNSLKLITNEQAETFPAQLDSKILNEIKTKTSYFSFANLKANAVSYLSYIVLIISLAGGYFLYNHTIFQEHQFKISQEKIEQQQELLNLIMTNQLEPITVEPKFEKEIVIQADL